jgi:alpha-amylase
LVDILLVFEVHQPYRIRRDFFWDKKEYRKLANRELFDYYFDKSIDDEIFSRASTKCYLPSNNILLKQIEEHKHGKKPVKVSFSISGVFLEQCEKFNKDVLESFKQLSETGCVEFLGQTYYHSISSLYPNKDEFIAQITKHRETVKELLGYNPTIFENTELIYNNEIAKTVEQQGFKGICTEGAEKIIGQNSPNNLLSAHGSTKLKVILRNYKLADDIGFRFSNRSWNEWPLTAEKYTDWLSQSSGQYICLFLDYETFGEHHWPETGIHDFLRKLPSEILTRKNLTMTNPSSTISEQKPVGMIDVPESKTVSWADIERSTHSWIGNDMQWAYYAKLRDLEKLVKESNDQTLTDTWRYLQISDHLYYMFTAGGGPGEVHSYFSPYGKPIDAFLSAMTVLFDFEHRLRIETLAANEPFNFQTSEGETGETGLTSQSLLGFHDALSRTNIKSIEFHRRRGDFEKWFEQSLRDLALADEAGELRESDLMGEKYIQALKKLVRSRIEAQKKTLQKMGYG